MFDCSKSMYALQGFDISLWILSHVYEHCGEVQYMILRCKKCCRNLPNKIAACRVSRALPGFENEHPLQVKFDSKAGA